MSTPSACPSPTPPTARSGSKRCSARRCGSIIMTTCRCSGWSRCCRPRRQNCSACPAARLRPARRPISPWSISMSRGSCSEADIKSRSKNTCFEGARLQGKVLQTHGRGPHSVFGISGRGRAGAWDICAVPIALVFGYLLGSIPFGLLITRAAGLGDVRKIGSGNIGATNVLRTGNKGLAAATLLLDALKGTAAVLIAGIYGPELAMVAGLGAFLGHRLPGLARLQGRQGRRHLSRRAGRARLAGRRWSSRRSGSPSRSSCAIPRSRR